MNDLHAQILIDELRDIHRALRVIAGCMGALVGAGLILAVLGDAHGIAVGSKCNE